MKFGLTIMGSAISSMLNHLFAIVVTISDDLFYAFRFVSKKCFVLDNQHISMTFSKLQVEDLIQKSHIDIKSALTFSQQKTSVQSDALINGNYGYNKNLWDIYLIAPHENSYTIFYNQPFVGFMPVPDGEAIKNLEDFLIFKKRYPEMVQTKNRWYICVAQKEKKLPTPHVFKV